ncbi:MAG: sigma-54 dependent transcriptional regulator [Candidatus Methylacidiphilales bacterium]
MPVEKILVVDDESAVRGVVADVLREAGYSVLAVSNLIQARGQVASENYDVVICDLKLPDGDGLEFLEELRRVSPRSKGVVMTGFGSMESALQALRLGVSDYLVKPIEPSALELAIGRLESMVRLEAENQYLRKETTQEAAEGIVWGESPAMQRIRDMVVKLGRAEATVLIQGESGTGKEVVAHALCQASDRADKPFVRVNCAAIPSNLLESEFFGHEKGAFTGAVQRRQGRFEIADGGTLLLDEISEIPPELQVKLLRVLQEREFERVGGNKTISVDVRVMATTNRDLGIEVKQGRFREDLFYRLNVVPIHLPPLRERDADALLLARHFLKTFCRKHGKHIKDLSPAARDRILTYPWPGNVRELQNVLERAVILAPDHQPLGEDQLALPEPRTSTQASILEPVTLAEAERKLILQALNRFRGNRTRAARVLGISLRTIRNKIREMKAAGIQVPGPDDELASGPKA